MSSFKSSTDFWDAFFCGHDDYTLKFLYIKYSSIFFLTGRLCDELLIYLP